MTSTLPVPAHRNRKRLSESIGIAAVICLLSTPAAAQQDVVLQWNEIAVNTMLAQSPGLNPFAQARFLAITQLAVFEAVNAITDEYEPYLGTVQAPEGASAEAAAIAAAHRVLRTYFAASGMALDTARATSLAAIPNGQSKDDGVSVGEAAAVAMIALRASDGSSPPAWDLPDSTDPGVWQLTPSCPAAGGVLYQWKNVTPFGIAAAADFIPGPPPDLTSNQYAKDYLEVKTVGATNSASRPQHKSDVARFYGGSSSGNLLSQAMRQLSVDEGFGLTENARALALMAMASNDALVASFATKYHYNLWRPETAIRAGDTDGNAKTQRDVTFVPYVTTPCFPSYPSNHAAGTGAGAEILRRIYGADGHSYTLSNPAFPGLTFTYSSFRELMDDVDDARVYGGIHFRFDQEAGNRLGREVATEVYKNNLRAKHP
jgi:hypothetical protein